MAKNLVVVESPAKIKSLKKYLGKDFLILASYGHVRDLVPKEGAVDTEHDFKMNYRIIERNEKHIDALAKTLKNCDALYLATDPDREGEAISWHVYELMKNKEALQKKPVHRVVFHEITKKAIQEAIKTPREISMDLVDAQQARRALDFLVGFNLSPLLWKKVRPGLSAGRVQSPALRLIVDREEEIEAFKPREYWTIEADCGTKKQPFIAKLVDYKEKKIEQFTITKEKQAKQIVNTLTKAANGELIVTKVEKKQRKRNPAAPFITSTLQQEAARKLGFSAKKTMLVAQQLYESGKITYMRTDSVTLAEDAITEIRNLIEKRYGKENLPDEPKRYQTKSKNAQEAHEAIRPTVALLTPDELKTELKDEQYKLYDLIWKRSVASQMIHATMDTVAIDLACGKEGIFRANGSVVTVPGFLIVYQEGSDDSKQPEGEGKILPPLSEGDKVKCQEIRPEQHFTEPPPRYSEASLVKALEEFGIGRPSTYASIISTLLYREYVILDNKRFKPTDVGRVVSKFLSEYFTQYVDYNFTAGMEDQLDAVARGEEKLTPMLEHFWDPFKNLVEKIDETVKRKDVTHEKIDEKCPECKKPLSIRLGRRGRFIGCTGFPECKYTRSLDGEESPSEPEIVEDRKCPDCESDLIIRLGRYGKFIGCSNYPKCKHIESLEKPKEVGVQCPECKQGDMVSRKSRYGKIFYSCSRYPNCKYAVWNEPVKKKCPDCKWPVLTIKVTKRRGTEHACPQKECGYTKSIKPPDEKNN